MHNMSEIRLVRHFELHWVICIHCECGESCILVSPEGLRKVYLGIWQGAVCVSCAEDSSNLHSIIFHWRNFLLFECKWEGDYQQTHSWDKDHNRLLWVLDHIKYLLVTARHRDGIPPNFQLTFIYLKVETSIIWLALFISPHFCHLHHC